MMKNTILGVLMVAGIFGPPSFPSQAQEKYTSEAYLESADLYLKALDEYPLQRPHLNFNIAQGFLRIDSTQRALNFMSQATSIGKRDKKLASLAWNNIGGIHAATKAEGQAGMPGQAGQPQAGKPDEDAPSPQEQALEDFKNALRNDPDNDLARYNYELMKRKLQQQQQEQNEDDQEKKEDQQQEEEKKDQKDQKNKNDQKNDQKDQQQDHQDNKENKGNNPKQGEGEAQKMSMEQAKMLLNAMNENEKKFLQQLQKSKAKRPNRERGPEW